MIEPDDMVAGDGMDTETAPEGTEATEAEAA